MDYQQFLKSKQIIVQNSGFNPGETNQRMFDFQRDISKWNLKKGRSATFAGTGLGKTLIEIEDARQIHEHSGGNVLILAPLAVSEQTVREGNKFNIPVNICRGQEDVKKGVNITNYEMIHCFDPKKFHGIILDESSILKSFSGKIRNQIIEIFRDTPYKQAFTATPAPNDYMELGNHAEFLGVMTRSEMLSTFFVHDGSDTQKWRLKGHAEKEFWNWVASWAVMLTKPSDLGYEDRDFKLPPLNMHQITVRSGNPTDGYLFTIEAQTLQERQSARRSTIKERANACAEIIDNNKWLIWCDLNAEQDTLKKIFGDKCVSIDGSTPNEKRLHMEREWREGDVPIMLTKPEIFGFGMNWQHCYKTAFVGMSDSFEKIYQAIRRCWRFGQKEEVDAYFITADTEGAVVRNYERKERDFNNMLAGMITATQEITRENIQGTTRKSDGYHACEQMILPEWMVSA